ncbi:hypothetical protein MHYP_G00019880 [Metynnis hypsauchen]
MNTGFMNFRNSWYVSVCSVCSVMTFCIQLSSHETVDLPAASRPDQMCVDCVTEITVCGSVSWIVLSSAGSCSPCVLFVVLRV